MVTKRGGALHKKINFESRFFQFFYIDIELYSRVFEHFSLPSAKRSKKNNSSKGHTTQQRTTRALLSNNVQRERRPSPRTTTHASV